jgi:iron complex outermembrane receptor protein
MSLKRWVSLLSIGAAIFVAAPSHAQSVPSDRNRTAQAGSTNTEGEGEEIGQVIVTAQRRSERQEDVPMTVSVLSGDALQVMGVSSTTELYRVTPGIQLPMFGAYVSPSIRGVSSNTTAVGLSSNVAFYLDGVYQPNQMGQTMDLADIESIEVLKGPQGTLYGQNAEGGAIVITTIDPKFKPQAKASVSYGNYSDVTFKGFETTGLSDKIAQSLSIYYENHDGFRRQLLTGERDKGLDSLLIRGKLLFQPSDSASIMLTGFYSTRKDSSAFSGIPWDGQSIARSEAPQTIAGATPDNWTTQPTFVRITTEGGTLGGSVDLGIGSLKATSFYNKLVSTFTADVDYSRLNAWLVDQTERSDYFTQNLDFISKRLGIFEFTTGAFYEHQNANYVPSDVILYSYPPFIPATTVYPQAPPVPFVDQYSVVRVKKDIYAAYLETGFYLGDHLKLTAGGRYSHETLKSRLNLGVFGHPLIDNPLTPKTWTNFSPRVTARYSLDSRNNIYASFSKGFKSGVIGPYDIVTPPAKPETLKAYEIGFKGTPTAWLQLEIAGFYYDYKDLQVSRFNPPSYIFQNAATARIKGVDVSAAIRATHELTFSASLETLDAKYGRFPSAGVYQPLPDGGLASVNLDLSGARLYRAPTFTGNLSANYQTDTSVGEFGANLSLYYSAKQKWDLQGFVVDPAYALLGAELSYSPAAMSKLRFALWGKNLTDKAHLMSLLETGVGAGVSYASPRQFGVRVEFSY